jgi:predicted N-acyltransferase
MQKQRIKKSSKGLGDTIATITHFFRIDKLASILARWMGKEDCGCDRRRRKLNKIVPYKKTKGYEHILRRSESGEGG